MPDFNVRSDSVNVEQIMEQIRARIREKRGVDYTEQQIRELAAVKLEKFLDPRSVRSDLLDQFREAQPAYELVHNLVVETTRTGIEVKNLKMRIESISSRLEFNERRARALEGVVVYKPAEPEEPAAPPPPPPPPPRQSAPSHQQRYTPPPR